MTLIKTQLKASIIDLMDALKTQDDQSASIEKFADEFSTIVDDYIKSATIIVPSGIPVATAGSAVAQTGSTTAPATATIS